MIIIKKNKYYVMMTMMMKMVREIKNASRYLWHVHAASTVSTLGSPSLLVCLASGGTLEFVDEFVGGEMGDRGLVLVGGGLVLADETLYKLRGNVLLLLMWLLRWTALLVLLLELFAQCIFWPWSFQWLRLLLLRLLGLLSRLWLLLLLLLLLLL